MRVVSKYPSGGGVGTAWAMAHAYSVFATGGRELGIATGDVEFVGRRGGAADARILRRVREGDGAQYSALYAALQSPEFIMGR